MLNAIWVLARTRFLITRNAIWRGQRSRQIGLIFLAVVIGFAAFGLYNFVRFLVQVMRGPEFAAALQEIAADNPGLPTDFTPYLLALPSIVLLGALLMLVLFSFSGLLSSLYLAGDMDMLLVAPVPMRAVFVVKFFGGLISQYFLLLALLGPVLLGYGQGMGYGLLYFITAILALLLLPLLSAGLGALLVMAIVRVLPARRAREIVSVIGGLIGISFYITSQLSPEIAPVIAGPGSLQALLSSNFPLLPSAWAGRALIAAGRGDILALTVFGSLFVVSSISVFLGCLALAERLYYDGWSNMAIQGGRVRSRKQMTGGSGQLAAESRWLAFLPADSRAILFKDLRLFVRDLRNLQQLIFPLALAGIWTFRLFTEPADTTLDSEIPAAIRQLSDLISAGIAFFICLSLSNALAGRGVSREGKTFWLLKLAPLSPMSILLGKFVLAYLPFPVIGTPFLVMLAILRHTSPALFIEQWLMLLLAGIGCTAFSIGLGAAFPRLDWENPQQQVSWQAGCLSTLFYPLYLFLVVGLVVGGSVIGNFAGSAAALGGSLLGWTLATLLTGAVGWGSAVMGVRGLERIEV
jgi:ABC-2 type transport system permease protein